MNKDVGMAIEWIIGVVFTVLWALTFYLLTSKDQKQAKEIDTLKTEIVCNRKTNEAQQLEIQHLRDKLWSEEKLTRVIVDAVSMSITRLENKWLKEGMLHNHTKRKGDPD